MILTAASFKYYKKYIRLDNRTDEESQGIEERLRRGVSSEMKGVEQRPTQERPCIFLKPPFLPNFAFHPDYFPGF
jgi:hypothetical protein